MNTRILSGTCPDEKCQAKLFFPSYDRSVECTACGQRHEQQALRDLEEVTNPNVALQTLIRNLLVGNTAPKKGAEMVKVRGLSNYHCKLLSPFLSFYGMDRLTGKAALLRDMKQEEIFDCSILGDRSFLIDTDHVDIVGYGRDISGSGTYLADTLQMITVYNGGQEVLIPVHADGDGHCLVHAVSRALVGRELFWHPLRLNLKIHFTKNIETYKLLFEEFIGDQEWELIINECDPEFQPPDGELLGLRNIHVFGLANVLRRPIVLLDSLSGMQSPGDYSALFLPSLVEPVECKGKSGEFNKPLCIAWSSPGRNHYIALVGIKHAPLPRLHKTMVPKPWGVPEELIEKYMELVDNEYYVISGDKCLQDRYVSRLAEAMEEVFMNQYKVHPSVVADVHHYVYKRTGVVGVQPREVLQATQKAIQEHRLYRCLTCDATCEQHILSEWFVPGGVLYSLAEQKHGKLRSDKLYSFPMQGITCEYDAQEDKLIPDKRDSVMEKCSWCQGSNMRLISGDGCIQYRNGDRTKTQTKSNYCNCGFKHYWDGEEFDNLPLIIPVTLEWGGKSILEKVPWFQYENDPARNSNVYEVANKLLQKHFPGVFGSERLMQKIVDQVLEQTKKTEEAKLEAPQSSTSQPEKDNSSPSKIIISGFKTVHKEELTMSETERKVKNRIEAKATVHQRKASNRDFVQAEEQKSSHNRKNPHIVPGIQKSPPSLPTKVVTSKVVRIVSSEGHQMTLHLDTVHTYGDLSQILEQKLNIPAGRQRILYGFPPKELVRPLPGEECTLPFQHGDKITVEILPFNVVDGDDENQAAEAGQRNLSATDTQNTLLKRIQDLQNSNFDRLDTAITSLVLSATLSGQNMWSYVQSMPQLFAEGGLYYSQVERDVGLVNGKHYYLPFLPDKVFNYNDAEHRLELCMEPYGHFVVEPGIEEKVLANAKQQESVSAASASEASVSNPSTSVTRLSGTSGVIVSKSMQILNIHKPFQGRGHVLSSNAKDLASPSCSDANKEESRSVKAIQKVNNEHSADPVLAKMQKGYSMTRKGPGVSFLNPDAAAERKDNVEHLHSLAEAIGGMLNSMENRQLPSGGGDVSPREDQPAPRQDVPVTTVASGFTTSSESTCVDTFSVSSEPSSSTTLSRSTFSETKTSNASVVNPESLPFVFECFPDSRHGESTFSEASRREQNPTTSELEPPAEDMDTYPD